MAMTIAVFRACAAAEAAARCALTMPDPGPCPGATRSAAAAALPVLTTALLLFGCAADDLPERGGSTAPAELSASVDRTAATIGDVFTWEVVVERSPDVEVNLAEPATKIEGLRLVDLGRGPVETLASGRIVERRWYRLRAEQVGSWALPALTGSWVGVAPDSSQDGAGDAEGGASTGVATAGAEPGGDLATAEIPLEVESVLPADASELTDIRDIKPLRRVEDEPRWLLWTGLAALAAALVAAVWWWRRRRQRLLGGDAPDAPRAPPWELAMKELERLRGADISDLRALRRHHFDLSSVVRAYVEGRFGLNATDLTTEEILDRLLAPPTTQPTARPAAAPTSRLGELDPAWAHLLERFLLATDQVKFAAHLPEREEVARTFDQALAFVEATRPAEADGHGDEQVDEDAAVSAATSEADVDRSGRAA